jgi:heat shock protein HtpX
MWELIKANRRKSLILFICMGACLIALGYFLGSAYDPRNGGAVGIILAGLIWLFLSLISFFAGDSIVLAISHAREVTRDVHPKLFNVVEEMKIAANLKKLPRIYIIDEPAPNAFATGRKPENSAIAVTAGLLTRLNRDELQGVVAHEMSHILNRDVLFMTYAGVMLGSIVLISEVFLRSLWYTGGSSRRYRSGKSGGQGQMIIIVVAVVLAILAPIMARLLYFAISRKREYLADASAVRLTRYPEGLASALEKISRNDTPLASANKVTAPMFISNPMPAKSLGFSGWLSTHPPIEERISILRKMTYGANYAEYQKAFKNQYQVSSNIIPLTALSDSPYTPIREAGESALEVKSSKSQKREVVDLMRKVNKFKFLLCDCGLRIKVPPDYKDSHLNCPRCGNNLTIPQN